jgi:hypothetical protein
VRWRRSRRARLRLESRSTEDYVSPGMRLRRSAFGPTKQRRFLVTTIWSPLRTRTTLLTATPPAVPAATSEVVVTTVKMLPLTWHLPCLPQEAARGLLLRRSVQQHESRTGRVAIRTPARLPRDPAHAGRKSCVRGTNGRDGHGPRQDGFGHGIGRMTIAGISDAADGGCHEGKAKGGDRACRPTTSL